MCRYLKRGELPVAAQAEAVDGHTRGHPSRDRKKACDGGDGADEFFVLGLTGVSGQTGGLQYSKRDREQKADAVSVC